MMNTGNNEFDFWAECYLIALKNGRGNAQAVMHADKALIDYRNKLAELKKEYKEKRI